MLLQMVFLDNWYEFLFIIVFIFLFPLILCIVALCIQYDEKIEKRKKKHRKPGMKPPRRHDRQAIERTQSERQLIGCILCGSAAIYVCIVSLIVGGMNLDTLIVIVFAVIGMLCYIIGHSSSK